MTAHNHARGTCLCGAVTVSVSQPAASVGACHCRMCRKWGGGPLLAVECGTHPVLWVLAIPVGAVIKLEFIWLLADKLNAMMAIPNLIGLLILGPMVFRLTREYWRAKK